MSTFRALNLEPEVESEDEMDDTREIQLEEAFKLYQNALKLHSQGPQSYVEASEAYRQLFQSEIFRYPEAVSEHARDELDNTVDEMFNNPINPLASVPVNVPDSSPSSLPQLVYLAFKNHGQFTLDYAQHLSPGLPSTQENAHSQRLSSIGKVLKDFAEALERDDTDLDLWRKAARVAEVLSSQRTVRFCLESVLAGDDDGPEEVVDISGLDEAYAAGELQDVLEILGDDLSKARNPVLRPKQPLLKLLRKRMDPYPFLPAKATHFQYSDDRRRPLGFQPRRHILCPNVRSWFSVGHAMLQAVIGEQQNTIDLGPGAALTIELPPEPASHQANDIEGVVTVLEPAQVEHVEDSSNSESPPDEDVGMNDSLGDGARDDVQEYKNPSVDRSEQAQGQTKYTVPETGDLESTVQGQEQHIDGSGQTTTLPSRKRSSAAAGNDETTEAARTKSKRLRARESNADLQEDLAIMGDLALYYEDQMAECVVNDQWMFSTVNELLTRLGVDDFGSLNDLKSTLQDAEGTGEPHNFMAPRTGRRGTQAVIDLREALGSWSDENSHALLFGHGSNEFGGGKAGQTIFLEHSRSSSQKDCTNYPALDDQGLASFVQKINSNWSTLHQATLGWLQALLQPSVQPSEHPDDGPATSTSVAYPYMRLSWSDNVKKTVVQLVVREDEQIYQLMQERLMALEEKVLHTLTQNQMVFTSHDIATAHMAEALFELHLDIYCLITNPSSQVDQATRIQQQDRLRRWSDLAGAFVNHYGNHNPNVLANDELVLRFVWASTTHATKAVDASQEHTMLCLRDLHSLLKEAGYPQIALPNNAAMPEVSARAVEQEISRLSTLDFFMSVFDSDTSDPVAVIESLEPILEPPAVVHGQGIPSSGDDEETVTVDGQADGLQQQSSQTQELAIFLETGDVSLKLFLWRRLGDAYQSIDYPPKVVSCYLRSIETIMLEFERTRHLECSSTHRQTSVLKWLKDLNEMLHRVLDRILHAANALECVDESHLRSSMSAIVSLSKILHGFTLWEDSVRVGQVTPPSLRSASSTKAFEKCRERLREMQVRAWTLQHSLLKDGMQQNQDVFPHAAEDSIEYLRSVHAALGVRCYCRYANKVFLKIAKKEILAVRTENDYRTDIAQILFDLHQLKLAPGVGDVDHACPVEPLDQKTAVQMVEVVMLQANRINIKDLGKSELKSTIDKILQAIGAPRANPALSHNRKTLNSFLRSPINPTELYKCTKGVGDLTTRSVQSDTVKIADHGWYFLLGHTALARFKSVKRVNPTPTDDLDIAATFFRQDLEHGVEKWETWYRLAQVYDAKIEDDLLWTADKINNHRDDLAALQRNAIHAYAMAVAVSVRGGDESSETWKKVSNMYADFAIRLYASSREPLSMDAFKSDIHQRHFSSGRDQTMYRAPSFPAMEPFTVWKLTAYLLRRAVREKPKQWFNHYILGKCLWKMFCNPENHHTRHPVTTHHILGAFTEAIEALPERKDSRSEYILEPHFKLVSVVHKLVHRKLIAPSQGAKTLQATPWAQRVHLSKDEEDWEPYILEVLKKIGNADKANWHHRIIARSAHVIYDDQRDLPSALGAKHEFTQQIFTKTMAIQVWKPENERAGRHFVYTSRYVHFFVGLLNQLNDRTNLDLLARRMRRKATEYLNHHKVWEDTVSSYVSVLRRIGQVPEGHERAVFENLNHGEFSTISAKLEGWAHDPDTTSMVLDILRDAIELKKLNNSLMKSTIIDDLIADTYASMYETFVSQLPPDEQHQLDPPAVDEQVLDPKHNSAAVPLLATTKTDIPGSNENRGRMSLDNFLLSHTGGPTNAPIPSAPQLRPIGLGLQSTAIYNATPPPSSSSVAGNDPQSVSATGPPAAAPAVPKAHRIKMVTRREVTRKAEGVVVRPPPIKTPILPKSAVFIEVPTPSKERTSGSADAAGAATGVPMGTRLEEIKDEVGLGVSAVGSEQSSRRGSVHDSADDESGSELSEVEDSPGEDEDEGGNRRDREKDKEKKAKSTLLFPGWMGPDTEPQSSATLSEGEGEDGGMDVDERRDVGEGNAVGGGEGEGESGLAGKGGVEGNGNGEAAEEEIG